MWPIRDASGDMIGFGARRIFDDDRIEAKYLNTPETPIYKKSQVLYGIDLARREIARASQAVVVEGYTDVMACHLAGVPPRSRPAAPRSATTTPECCAGCCTTTTSSAAR